MKKMRTKLQKLVNESKKAIIDTLENGEIAFIDDKLIACFDEQMRMNEIETVMLKDGNVFIKVEFADDYERLDYVYNSEQLYIDIADYITTDYVANREELREYND